ncbi:outer membrane beta-barrel protein [Winogradskyella sp.]|uniref:outer membrane beta-barrel protein n=1 Tax=Winogradskyella sp. TaxID=1883156 RepID=UPI002605919F|nr:outer membrane beta-barrel protein [Winogradskyella sp.]
MKKDKIEELYDSLKILSKEPPAALWDNIEARLHPKKKKRRGLFFIWGSAAAILIVFIGYMLNDLANNDSPVKKVTDIEYSEERDTIDELDFNTTKNIDEVVTTNTDEDDLPNSVNGNDAISSGLIEQKEQKENLSEYVIDKKQDEKDAKSRYNKDYALVVQEEENNKINSADIQMSKTESGSTIDRTKETAIANNDSIVKIKERSLLDISEELLAENNNTKDTLNTEFEAISKWTVEVLGGVSNTASDASIQGTSVNTSSQNDFVYTLKVGYALSDRWVIKSGIGNNVLGQEINNIGYVSPGTSLFAGDAQSLVNNQEVLFFVSPGSASQDGASDTTTDVGTLEQQFNYIQIPLEFSYHVLKNQKYTLSFGIGGNVNFLTDNRAFLDDEQIGESLGVDATVFGATLNSNVSYQLTKRMNLFLEPSYNYFQKPINNSNQEFSNTQLRFLFGIRYKL